MPDTLNSIKEMFDEATADEKNKFLFRAIQKIDDLPYLLRAVTIDAEPELDSGLIIFKYGGFLYVDESLAKN